MAKDRSEAERAAKKDKKEKKEKKLKGLAEENGVSKTKEKKHKKEKVVVVPDAQDVTTTLLNKVEKKEPGSVTVDADGDVQIKMDDEVDSDGDKAEVKVKKEHLVGAIVPFANPLADEKTQKRVFKIVKKAAKHRTLKRGVKETVKALRKSDTPKITSVPSQSPPAIVILAGDISPMDVISHIPVLCEDHSVPYLFVPSRADLGVASSTKRPTSVVMVTAQHNKKKEAEDKSKGTEEKENWEDVYKELAKVVEKAGRHVKI